MVDLKRAIRLDQPREIAALVPVMVQQGWGTGSSEIECRPVTDAVPGCRPVGTLAYDLLANQCGENSVYRSATLIYGLEDALLFNFHTY